MIRSTHSPRLNPSRKKDTGWQLIAEGGLSNDASLDINFDPANWRVLRVIFTNFEPIEVDPDLRLRTSNSAAFDSGAGDYKHAGVAVNSESGTFSSLASTGTDSIKIATLVGGDAGETADGVINIFDPSGTVNWTKISYQTTCGADAADLRTHYGHGTRIAAENVDGLQFLFSSGNIATGDYRIYGLKE